MYVFVYACMLYLCFIITNLFYSWIVGTRQTLHPRSGPRSPHPSRPPLHFGDPLVSCSVLEHLSQCLSLHQCQVDFFGRIVDASEFIMPTGSLLGTVKPHFGVNDVDILPCRSEHFTQKETPVVSKPLLVFVGMWTCCVRSSIHAIQSSATSHSGPSHRLFAADTMI